MRHTHMVPFFLREYYFYCGTRSKGYFKINYSCE
jgi:hypothetical protein